MNNNQNEKIAQITSQTLIIGVDIAKYKHVGKKQCEFSEDRMLRDIPHMAVLQKVA